MIGLTDKHITKLFPLAKFWSFQANVTRISGFANNGYDKDEHTYRFRANAAGLSFVLNASKMSPIYKSCFVIRNSNDGDMGQVSVTVADDV